jgi:hypothetical protein
MARREAREYREYLSAEQRRQAGVPNAAAALGWRRDASPAECHRNYESQHLGKPLARTTRLSVRKAGEGTMRDWSFSDTAEWVVGLLLAVVIVATILV